MFLETRFLWKQPLVVWLLSLQGQFPVFATVFRVFQTFVICDVASIATDQLQEIHVSLLSKSVSSVVLGFFFLVVISVIKKNCLKHTNLQVSLSKRPGSVVVMILQTETKSWPRPACININTTPRLWGFETKSRPRQGETESRARTDQFHTHINLNSLKSTTFFVFLGFSGWLLSSSENIFKVQNTSVIEFSAVAVSTVLEIKQSSDFLRSRETE